MEPKALRIEDLHINQTIYMQINKKYIKAKIHGLTRKYVDVLTIESNTAYTRALDKITIYTPPPELITFPKQNIFLGKDMTKFCKLMRLLLEENTLIYEGEVNAIEEEGITTITEVSYDKKCDNLVIQKKVNITALILKNLFFTL